MADEIPRIRAWGARSSSWGQHLGALETGALLAAAALLPMGCVNEAVGPALPHEAQSAGTSEPGVSGESAKIVFPLSQPGSVTVRIYDGQGGLVRSITESLVPGVHELEWDGRTSWGIPAGSGVYAYVLDLPDGTQVVARLVLVR